MRMAAADRGVQRGDSDETAAPDEPRTTTVVSAPTTEPPSSTTADLAAPPANENLVRWEPLASHGESVIQVVKLPGPVGVSSIPRTMTASPFTATWKRSLSAKSCGGMSAWVHVVASSESQMCDAL